MCPPAGKDSRRRPSPCKSRGRAGIIPPFHDQPAFSRGHPCWRTRSCGYLRLKPVETTYAARTMRWGVVLIFLYVVYHLLDLTFGRVNPSFVPGDVYHNVVASLRVWPVAAAYIAAMVVLGLHLYHGTWSALQTLGLNPPPTGRWRRGAAAAIAVLIAGGYISIPVAVLAGVLRVPWGWAPGTREGRRP